MNPVGRCCATANLMRWLLICLILCLVACDSDKIAQLEKENIELTARLASATTAANLDSQAKCAQQARAAFVLEGWSKDSSASFTNHYQLGTNKCFMETTSMDLKTKPYVPNSYRSVSDAFEGKVYAEYYWRNDKGKKYWEVEPFQCEITTLTGEKTVCKSTQEYERLIKQFMEN
jgi:hypothetical protein